MARVSTILTNFRAGELSPKLFGRIDLHADLGQLLQVELKMMVK